MTTEVRTRASRAEIDAAMLLLSKIGVSPQDLVSEAAGARPTAPTFAEFVPLVAAATGSGTLKAYGTYWNRLVQLWGARRIDEPTALELESFGKQLRAARVIRRNDRGGTSAEENYVSAIRCLYRRAVANGYLSEADNTAAKVAKPRRQASVRHAMHDDRLAEINHAASHSGDDPELDSLLLRLHQETACRRGGALNLRPVDLDEEQCLIRLREKGETMRWQPVSPTLMRHLIEHWKQRGDGNRQGTARLLRYRDRSPLTYRRYDGMWDRLGHLLPWVAAQGISTHWIRHTILTWVERNFGYAVARAYAGHNDRRNGDAGTTATYVRADIHEVAKALVALTGEPHPLCL